MSSETVDKHIRVSVRVHDRIKALKRDDETMGEAIDRLIDGYTLAEFATETKPIGDDAAREQLCTAYEEYTEDIERTMAPDNS